MLLHSASPINIHLWQMNINRLHAGEVYAHGQADDAVQDGSETLQLLWMSRQFVAPLVNVHMIHNTLGMHHRIYKGDPHIMRASPRITGSRLARADDRAAGTQGPVALSPLKTTCQRPIVAICLSEQDEAKYEDLSTTYKSMNLAGSSRQWQCGWGSREVLLFIIIPLNERKQVSAKMQVALVVHDTLIYKLFIGSCL
ncbi:unnamed protein product, partial [Trichogramma brassicae]